MGKKSVSNRETELTALVQLTNEISMLVYNKPTLECNENEKQHLSIIPLFLQQNGSFGFIRWLEQKPKATKEQICELFMVVAENVRKRDGANENE